MPHAGKPGFRVLPSPPRLSDDLLTRFHGLASSTVADAMGRFGFMDSDIQPRTGLPLCGVAVTVNCRPGDNLMVHKALQQAEAGDVVVVSTGRNLTNAVFGELMCRMAAARRLGGIVVDGAIRDVEGITQLEFPAFSRSISPGACDKDGPGEINVPISCGGAVVMPGDVIIGDADGVVVVPRASAEDVLEAVAAILERERERIAEIQAGRLVRGDVDDLLRKKGIIE